MPFPSPGDLPDPGIKLRSQALQAESSPAEPAGEPIDTIFKPLVLFSLCRLCSVPLVSAPFTPALRPLPSFVGIQLNILLVFHCNLSLGVFAA